MALDHIRYDILAQAALRGVVRTVLADVAKKGLPGEHHFKISFNTAAPGVRLSERMRAQYPQAMTIVLQHQFWDLVVRDETFDVGLSFGGVPERLTVPFEAVTAFYDPAVQFGFQFETIESEAADDANVTAKVPERSSGATAGSAARPPAEQKKADALPAPAATESDLARSAAGTGGEVVSLDRFRKK
ncbi:MAG: ClpXP protease specificity-enhancing factor SspB [Xanthobacteraceae bacterium]